MKGSRPDTAPDGPPPRSRRDWFVDACLFLSAVAFAMAVVAGRLNDPLSPRWVLGVDQLAGLLGCAALWLRRRWPVEVALALVPLSSFAESVGGAQLVALFAVAVHRSFRTTAAVGAVSLLAAPVYAVLRPEPDVPGGLVVLLGVVLTLAVVGWGQFVRHRRQLADARVERAVRAETEARLRLEQAQHLAREEIAREMHDVLGHRLSLLSVHAGALEYRPDAPAEEIARAAAVIRESAHQALQDLREVIGVLRAPVGELPQPTLADVPALVADSVRAGMRVDLRVEAPQEAPAGLGRTTYRVIQEGLTNARKHAPGADVHVTVRGGPGEGLTTEVRTSTCGTTGERAAGALAAGVSATGVSATGARTTDTPVPGGSAAGGRSTETAGTGRGLVGLAERAAQAGGRLTHGPTGAGGFVISAWLPWPRDHAA